MKGGAVFALSKCITRAALQNHHMSTSIGLEYFWEIMVLRDSIVVYPEYVSAVQTRTGTLTT